MTLLFLSILSPVSQHVPGEGWRGIVPLHSTRADVERMFGKSDHRCGCFYRLGDAKVSFDYSYGSGCAKGQVGGWNVMRDTVTHIMVTPLATIPFSELPIDKTKYKAVEDQEVIGVIYHVSQEDGVSIAVGETGSVIYFGYGPSAKDGIFIAMAGMCRRARSSPAQLTSRVLTRPGVITSGILKTGGMAGSITSSSSRK